MCSREQFLRNASRVRSFEQSFSNVQLDLQRMMATAMLTFHPLTHWLVHAPACVHEPVLAAALLRTATHGSRACTLDLRQLLQTDQLAHVSDIVAAAAVVALLLGKACERHALSIRAVDLNADVCSDTAVRKLLRHIAKHSASLKSFRFALRRLNDSDECLHSTLAALKQLRSFSADIHLTWAVQGCFKHLRSHPQLEKLELSQRTGDGTAFWYYPKHMRACSAVQCLSLQLDQDNPLSILAAAGFTRLHTLAASHHLSGMGSNSVDDTGALSRVSSIQACTLLTCLELSSSHDASKQDMIDIGHLSFRYLPHLQDLKVIGLRCDGQGRKVTWPESWPCPPTLAELPEQCVSATGGLLTLPYATALRKLTLAQRYGSGKHHDSAESCAKAIAFALPMLQQLQALDVAQLTAWDDHHNTTLQTAWGYLPLLHTLSADLSAEIGDFDEAQSLLSACNAEAPLSALRDLSVRLRNYPHACIEDAEGLLFTEPQDECLLFTLTELTRLSLTACGGTTEHELPPLPELPCLRSLQLTRCALPDDDDAGEDVFNSLRELSQLTELELDSCFLPYDVLDLWPNPQLVKLTIGCIHNEAVQLASLLADEGPAMHAALPVLQQLRLRTGQGLFEEPSDTAEPLADELLLQGALKWLAASGVQRCEWLLAAPIKMQLEEQCVAFNLQHLGEKEICAQYIEHQCSEAGEMDEGSQEGMHCE